MDVVSGIIFSNRAPERRSKSAEKNSATQTKNRPSGAAIRRGALDGLAGVGIAAPTGAAPIFSNYVTPSQ